MNIDRASKWIVDAYKATYAESITCINGGGSCPYGYDCSNCPSIDLANQALIEEKHFKKPPIKTRGHRLTFHR